VKCERRDQTDDAAADSRGDSDQIRISQWFAAGKTIHTTADHLKRSGITHSIKRARMDAPAQRLSREQDTPVFAKNSYCPVEPGTELIRIF
jgi:hypothetical protein